MDAITAKAQQLFMEQNFVVLDTETTGKETWSAEIVEIVIIDHQGNPLLYSLVKPTRSIPQDAVAIHGITDERVKDAPTFPELFPKIDAVLKDKVAIVYNASYDIGLIESLAERHGLGFWAVENWCLMRGYAEYRKTPGRYGDYKWHKLSDACKQQGIAVTNGHSALGDALATLALLKKLAEMEK